MLRKEKHRLLILGAGGYGKSLAEVAALTGQWAEICFIDDQWPRLKDKNDYLVISDIAHLKNMDLMNCEAIAAVGNNQIRKRWHEMSTEMGIPLATIIHPQAIISPSVKIEAGVSIMAGCVLGTDVQVHRGCILNSGVILDHDVVIEEYAHLSIGVKVAGNIRIAEFSSLEVGSTIVHNG
ncbi:acetyltransferase [Alkanindiges illinoisensis]|uniref:Acetyltransferase n=1 Tax=Alkanindiges illinoisensis TaxID=197183 RepID=A0A4Y7XBY0_9GAMM|nr:acetyltransferase [Alkanindiges illinoisensis]TEU26815.1 acetyltransferase [Alkanindiges illinoisensis]